MSGPLASRDRRRGLLTQEKLSPDHSRASSVHRDSTSQADPGMSERIMPNTHNLHMDKILSRDGWHSPPSRKRPEDWEAFATPLVLQMLSNNNRPPRVCGVLPTMLLTAADNSPLPLSCRALGTAVLANKVDSQSARAIRDQTYGKALVATNNALGDAEMCKEDDVLVGVWMLSLYEVSIACPFTKSSES